MEWQFVVPGQPVPQPRHKVTTRGGRGHAYIRGGHPIHAYRKAVGLAAAGRVPSSCYFVVDIEAVFERPKSHRTKRGLKASAPAFPPKCDWDNLGKGVCDALTGLLWEDDDQIVDGHVAKRYAAPGEQPHTRIIARAI